MSVDEIVGTWDYGTVPANISIGRDCFFERRESFSRFRSLKTPGLVIGDRVRVYTWTSFNVDPDAMVEIGDDCVLVGAVFMCAHRITLGRGVVVSYNVTIADSDFHPIDPDARIRDAIANAPYGDRSTRPPIDGRPVVVGDGVWIGIGAIVLKGVHIGDGARIGPGAVVTADVPARAEIVGNPGVIR